MRIARNVLIAALFSALLGGCGFIGFPGVYRIDIEQGNIVTPEMASQLQPGMSRRQVRFILGTPLVEDTFNQDRWDYHYSRRQGVELREAGGITVVFDGDSLVEVRGDYLPPAWETETAEAPPQEVED